jgi:hypothetical protein
VSEIQETNTSEIGNFIYFLAVNLMERTRQVLIIYEHHPEGDIDIREKEDPYSSLEDFVKAFCRDPTPVLSELRKRGVDTRKTFAECLREDWQSLRDKVNETISKLDLKKMKLYVDTCTDKDKYWSKIENSVEEGEGSESDKLFVDLKKAGAQPEDTESAGLLLLDYAGDEGVIRDLRKCMEFKSGEETYRGLFEAVERLRNALIELGPDGLTELRNMYIASKIDETLRDGETALLFIGFAHRKIEHWLEKRGIDCEVIYESKLSPLTPLYLQIERMRFAEFAEKS